MSAPLPPFDRTRLRAVSLNISALRVACAAWTSPRNQRSAGLVRIEGTYGDGSNGTDDALFIRWKLREFLELRRVDGLVIDCTELRYAWGDDLCLIPRREIGADPLPLLVVLREAQAEAFRHVVDASIQRGGLGAALAEMAETIRVMKPRL